MDNRKLYSMALAERLRGLREQRNWRQADLAAKAGVSAIVVSRMERGEQTNPTLKTLVGLSHALGAPIGYLVGELDSSRAKHAIMPPFLWADLY